MDNIGNIFEEDLSKEFGINKTINSGSFWFSKMDLIGRGARWSLKATSKKSFSLSQDIINEARQACASEGSIPVWALRIGSSDYDVIVIGKEDFKLLQKGDIQLINGNATDKTLQRRIRANTPVLLRDNLEDELSGY